MQTCWNLGSCRLNICNVWVDIFCWWRLIYGSFSVRGGHPCEGYLSYQGPFLKSVSSHWCYLLPGGPSGRKRCHSPRSSGSSSSTADGEEYRKARKAVCTWYLASQIWISSRKINIPVHMHSLSHTYYSNLWWREDRSNLVWKYLHKILQGLQGSSELQKHPP